MSDFIEKTIDFPEVKNFETGELLLPAQSIKIKTREDVPFRSITDLKGFNDNERPCKSSITNDVNYIPLEKLVTQIFRCKTIKELREMQVQNPEDYDEDDEIEAVDDIVEQDDYVQSVLAHNEQDGSRSANADRGHSGDRATTTSGEGANGEAVSDGDAE